MRSSTVVGVALPAWRAWNSVTTSSKLCRHPCRLCQNFVFSTSAAIFLKISWVLSFNVLCALANVWSGLFLNHRAHFFVKLANSPYFSGCLVTIFSIINGELHSDWVYLTSCVLAIWPKAVFISVQRFTNMQENCKLSELSFWYVFVQYLTKHEFFIYAEFLKIKSLQMPPFLGFVCHFCCQQKSAVKAELNCPVVVYFRRDIFNSILAELCADSLKPSVGYRALKNCCLTPMRLDIYQEYVALFCVFIPTFYCQYTDPNYWILILNRRSPSDYKYWIGPIRFFVDCTFSNDLYLLAVSLRLLYRCSYDIVCCLHRLVSDVSQSQASA